METFESIFEIVIGIFSAIALLFICILIGKHHGSMRGFLNDFFMKGKDSAAEELANKHPSFTLNEISELVETIVEIREYEWEYESTPRWKRRKVIIDWAERIISVAKEKGVGLIEAFNSIHTGGKYPTFRN